MQLKALVCLGALLFSNSAGSSDFFAIKNGAPSNVTDRKTSLIWIVNETNYKGYSLKNFTKLKNDLEKIGSKEAKTVLSQIKRDSDEFPRVANLEFGVLKNEIPKSKITHAFIVSNSLASQSKALFYARGTGWQNKSLELESTKGSIIEGMPLNHQNNLAATLNLATSLINKNHEVILFFKSHGSAEYGVTPRVALDVTNKSKEDLAKILEGTHTVDRLGILKRDFLKTIESLNTSFDMVVLEACGSGLFDSSGSNGVVDQFPGNIQSLVLSKSENTKFKNFELGKWLEKSPQSGAYAKTFASLYVPATVSASEAVDRKFNSIWLIPLLITSIWASAEFFNRRKQSNA